jgi:MFS family permease
VIKGNQKLPPHYRWNYTAFLLDYVFFGVAFNFFSPTSVLPAFVGQLTDTPLLIGLSSTVFNGCWMLPQLAFARLIGDKPRKATYMRAGVGGRALLALIAVALWLGLARYPAAMLIVFFVCLGLWALSDGATSVAWFDILARALPMRARGRLMGAAQVMGGVIGIGAGALIGLIIARRPFPADYALVFTIGAATLVPSAIALFSIREPPPADNAVQPTRQTKSSWLKPLTNDPLFRRLTACRVMVGLVGLATSFYVSHATRKLMLPDRVVGSFLIAQTAASVISSAALGLIAERRGPQYAMRIGAAAAAAGPLLAVVLDVAGTTWAVHAYPIVYVALGVVNSASMPGFLNYLMEIPPDGERAAYLGLGNTIMGLLTLAPLAGGWFLERTSYAALFGVTAAAVTIGFLLTLRIGPARQPAAAAEHDA